MTDIFQLIAKQWALKIGTWRKYSVARITDGLRYVMKYAYGPLNPTQQIQQTLTKTMTDYTSVANAVEAILIIPVRFDVMVKCKNIMQTCPYNVYPLTPHFYIVKLGFKGVLIVFLFLL